VIKNFHQRKSSSTRAVKKTVRPISQRRVIIESSSSSDSEDAEMGKCIHESIKERTHGQVNVVNIRCEGNTTFREVS
jgi:hypothetical protein